MRKPLFNSMTVRFFLILLGGTVASAGLALALAAYEGKDMLVQLRMRHLSERVEQVLLMLDVTTPANRAEVGQIASRSGVRVDLSNSAPNDTYFADSESTAALTRTLGEERRIGVFERDGLDCPSRPSPNGKVDSSNHRCRTVYAQLRDGTPVRIDVASPPERLPPPFRPDYLPYLWLFLFCVSALAFLVAHLATKPLRRLAQAAHELGNNLERPRLPEDHGPSEVRDAARAFNSMQSRIRHFIEERTYMLAAIAHDLQTPLTRLRLRLEKVSDEELRQRLINDLIATQDMVREGLELARSLNTEEPFELVDLDALITTICDDATDAGQKVTHSGKLGIPVRARSHALRRGLANLVDNAVKYGGFAHVTVKKYGDKAIISVMDGGPGIPEDQLELVLQPFKRLEDSRSRTSGGTGLGLTIAGNIAEKHRGNLRLRNVLANGYGLEAILEISIN